jgi:uncharacterized membrane protein YobD (UPF0266 family)
MSDSDVKLHEKKNHTIIIFFVAVICILIGLQNMTVPESKNVGILAVVTGVLLIGVAIYMFFMPMVILSRKTIFFKSGNISRRTLDYSEIKSWALREDKYLIFRLKGEEGEQQKNTITLNYCNLSKDNQKTLIDELNKNGVERIFLPEPEKKIKK